MMALMPGLGGGKVIYLERLPYMKSKSNDNANLFNLLNTRLRESLEVLCTQPSIGLL